MPTFLSRFALLLAGPLLLAQTPAAVNPPVPEPAALKLPAPRTEGGKPLMQALRLRATSRAFAPESLPDGVLSDLLWAANGVNRPAEGKRTAPTARNWQEMDVYVLMAKGAYRYDPAAHALVPVAAGDHRAAAGSQPFVKDAPLTLVMVADRARMKGVPETAAEALATGDAAFVCQNVYLYSASEGLATGVRASMDKTALAKTLKLAPTQIAIFAQSVGYPKKK